MNSFIITGEDSTNIVRMGASITLPAGASGVLSVCMAYKDTSGNTVPIGSMTSWTPSTGVALTQASVPATPGSGKHYFVVAWINPPGTSGYDPSYPQDSTFGIWDLYLVSNDQYTSQIAYLLEQMAGGGIFDGLYWASTFLGAFLGAYSVPGANSSPTGIINNNDPHLHENTGVVWYATGSAAAADILENHFDSINDLANKVRTSIGFIKTVRATLNKISSQTTVTGYTWLPGETSHIFTFNGPDTMYFEKDTDEDLHYAFGGVGLSYALAVTVQKTGLSVSNVDITGTLSDLYDFNVFTSVLSNAGAEVQACYSPGGGQPDGLIFRTVVALNATGINFGGPFNY